MSDRWDETWHRLREWTNGQGPSERLAAQILSADGFTSVDPSHPLGGRDGTKDAVVIRGDQRWVMAVYFPRGQQSLVDVKGKFIADHAGVAKNQAAGMAFVTNQELTLAQRDELKASVSGLTEIYHLERLVALLDQPSMHPVRQQFLNIGIPDDGLGSLGRERLLATFERQATRRRRQRLRAAGVPEERVDAVLELMAADTAIPVEVHAGQVGLLLASMGHGKTEVAHHWYLGALDRARAADDAPMPLWLPARHVTADVESAAVDKLGLPTVASVGCTVVLDGLDEVDPIQAERLVSSAEEFAAGWVNVSVLATGRPQRLLDRYATLPMAAWTTDRGWALAETVAGNHLPPTAWSAEILDALNSPLLAIALGAQLAAGNPPASRTHLLSTLAEQSLRSARITLTDRLTSTLVQIAAHNIENDTGFNADRLSADALSEVERTPLVVNDRGSLTFVLPVLEQFYATRALKQGLVDIRRVASSAQFPRWRYALALAVDITDPVAADEIMATLTVTNPAAASWVLDEVTRTHTDDSDAAPDLDDLVRTPVRSTITTNIADGEPTPPAVAIGLRLRDAELAWIDGLGPLRRQLANTRSNEKRSTWSVSLDDTRFAIAELRTPSAVDIELHDPTSPVMNLGAVGPPWSRLTSDHVPRAPLGRWRWSRDRLRAQLVNAVQRFALDCDPAGPLAAERAWRLAQIIHHGSVRVLHEPIPVVELRERVTTRLAQTANSVRATWLSPAGNVTRDDLVWLDAHLATARHFLERPYVLPDRLLSHRTWALYSRERTHQLVTQVLTAAVEGYQDLVERNFPSFGPALGTSSIWPIRVVGTLHTLEDAEFDTAGFEGAPWLSYAVVHDDRTTGQPLVDIQPAAQLTQNDDHWLNAIRRSVAHGGPFAPTRVISAALHLEGAMPATGYAYQWLINDLVEVGWLENSWAPRTG